MIVEDERDMAELVAMQLQREGYETELAHDGREGLDRIKRGTGLGLAIVKCAAERLGASIDLESRVGAGTTFTVTIPIAEGERRPGASQEPTDV